MIRAAVAVAVVALLAACSNGDAVFEKTEASPPCIGQEHEAPDAGWLSDDGLMPSLEGKHVKSSEGLDAVVDALPRGFLVTRAEELALDDDCSLERVVEAVDADGGTLFIEQRQLDDTGTLFNIPLSGRQAQAQHGSRGELVTDDFNGDGNRVTALVVTDTGAWTLVVARGLNGPNLSGWPTTMATIEPSSDPRPAPLSLVETVGLAEQISESTSNRSSR